MRPINLEVEGFTSFRQRVAIDFSGLDLFAITGPTGSGKTSIIDAMTYALYGCTPRLGRQGISELISQGADRLKVLLEFACGKERYRIARETKKTAKSISTDLRFDRWEADRWVSLADRVTQADELVGKIIGLDFNGFTKSVVLPQGRFDDLLKGNPRDRRKILSDLLGLEVYTGMMKRANEIAQDHRGKAEFLENLLARDYAAATPENLKLTTQELERLRPSLQELDSRHKQITKLAPEAHRLKQARAELTQCVDELNALRPMAAKASGRVEEIRQAVTQRENNIAGIETDIKANPYNSEYHMTLVRMLEKSQHLNDLDKKRAQLEKGHELKGADLSSARAEHASALKRQKAAAADRAAFQKQAEAGRKQLELAMKKYGSADAIASLIEVNKRLIADSRKKARFDLELSKLAEGRKDRTARLAKVDTSLRVAQNKLQEVRAQLESLKRLHSAEELRRALKEGEPCPVCSQAVKRIPKAKKHPAIATAQTAVSQEERNVTEYEKQKSAIQAEVRQLAPQIEDKQSQIKEAEAAIAEAVSRIAAVLGRSPGPETEADLNELRKEIKSLQEKTEENAEQLDRLRESEAAASNRAKDSERQVSVLEAEISGLARELDRARSETRRLAEELGEYADLSRVKADLAKQENARAERDELMRRKESDSGALSKAKDEMAEALRARENLHTKITELDKSRQRVGGLIDELVASLQRSFAELGVESIEVEADAVTMLERHLTRVEARRTELQTRVAEYEQRTKSLAEQITRAAQLRSDLDRHRVDGAVARELALALRGDQFIAFIQQEAYQRLAVDGSHHLRTLSSGRYSFGVESDDFVVLDQWNADETRPVATLSGGESFLASLALALALAEGLSGLSHGSGRFALESLFLDEGFGSLDAETLDVVLQGIENLSTTDRLVGIVSHIPELAERMPTRINVQKSIGGSTVEMS